jgi:hypothetical protein
MIKLKEENWILATELTAMKESYNSVEKNMNSIKGKYYNKNHKITGRCCILFFVFIFRNLYSDGTETRSTKLHFGYKIGCYKRKQ